MELTESELATLCAYSRLPDRLKDMLGEQGITDVEDEFGVEDRLRAIKSVLKGAPLNDVIDLGGNAGFYCLTFADAGMLSHSTVIDLDRKALDAGQKMAAYMGLQDKVDFKEQRVDLDFVQSLPQVHTIICLNLIHHAGVLFDGPIVAEVGWDEYARRWLSEFRKKSKLLIFGVGLKGQKPVHWDIPAVERAGRIVDIAKQSGWTVIYDANVQDIARLGVAAANGARIGKSHTKERMANILRRLPVLRRMVPDNSGKTHKYHLFIMNATPD